MQVMVPPECLSLVTPALGVLVLWIDSGPWREGAPLSFTPVPSHVTVLSLLSILSVCGAGGNSSSGDLYQPYLSDGFPGAELMTALGLISLDFVSSILW